MKIATFNINNVNKRLSNLLRWLKRSRPDVICLQESKCENADFPEQELQKAGYSAVWEGQKSWNGVAIGGACPATLPTAKLDTSKRRSTAY
jgi:exodeoxyribonuclease-3